jgi:Protein of unknown function (DUF3551)
VAQFDKVKVGLGASNPLREVFMRLPILSLFLIAAGLLGEIQTVSAQSPTSYPWCAKYFGSWMAGATSCYFTSYQQCRTTLSGIGGVCFKSPYHRAPLNLPARRRHA